jgi:hypothetical protein
VALKLLGGSSPFAPKPSDPAAVPSIADGKNRGPQPV